MKNLPADTVAVSNAERRNQAIRDEFARQKSRGVQSRYIIIDLAYRFYLEESTVESIVWKRGRYGASVGPRTRELVAA
ncbi:hypothetical protein [Spirosoma aerolatum]|uniref:hypothetical protein n=1 Tax=Spirosoma aerolatum TaxID=1211326 RepID=UPI0012D2EA13|nr:hypothetical protein [Spirosoma aerolatum]